MKIIDCEQGSDEWLAARVGRVGASRIADIVARTKSGYSTSRANYAAELVAERLTGSPAERFTNAAMAWGTEHEGAARGLYEMAAGASVTTVGIVLHPTIGMAQCSPDGLIGEDGCVEIKCPITATHINTLLTQTIDGKYLKQMQWQMACTGVSWCDFVSYDPRMPEEMQLFVQRVRRDDALIADLEAEVTEFLSEIDETIAKLQAKYGQKEAAE